MAEYRSPLPWFRDLTAEEVEEFQQYARDHEPPGPEILALCHPICREEWQRLGKLPAEDQ